MKIIAVSAENKRGVARSNFLVTLQDGITQSATILILTISKPNKTEI